MVPQKNRGAAIIIKEKKPDSFQALSKRKNPIPFKPSHAKENKIWPNLGVQEKFFHPLESFFKDAKSLVFQSFFSISDISSLPPFTFLGCVYACGNKNAFFRSMRFSAASSAFGGQKCFLRRLEKLQHF